MRVISTILTLSPMCSGVRFFPLHNGAMVSEEITNPDTYARFLKIPGFAVYEPAMRDVADQQGKPNENETVPAPPGDAAGQDPDPDVTGQPDANAAPPAEGIAVPPVDPTTQPSPNVEQPKDQGKLNDKGNPKGNGKRKQPGK